MHLSRGLNVMLFIFALISLSACSSLPQIPTLQELVFSDEPDKSKADPSSSSGKETPAEDHKKSRYSLQLVQLRYVNAQGLQPIVARLSSGKGSTYVGGHA